jgi:hypothetical protein
VGLVLLSPKALQQDLKDIKICFIDGGPPGIAPSHELTLYFLAAMVCIADSASKTLKIGGLGEGGLEVVAGNIIVMGCSRWMCCWNLLLLSGENSFSSRSLKSTGVDNCNSVEATSRIAFRNWSPEDEVACRFALEYKSAIINDDVEFAEVNFAKRSWIIDETIAQAQTSSKPLSLERLGFYLTAFIVAQVKRH